MHYIYETFTSQEEKIIDAQVSKAGELVVRAGYLSSMIAKTNWY